MAATHEYFVSTAGDDSNPGTRERPFASPLRARDAVRAEIAAGLRRSITVYLCGGTYWLPDGLSLGAEDSGTAECAVTYRSAPGETAALVGGVRLANWRRHRGEVVAADLPRASASLQVFENGRRMTLARLPKAGYFKTEGPLPEAAGTGFTFREGDLAPAGWTLSGARVYLWPEHDWFSHERAVRSIDGATRAVGLDGSRLTVTAGNRYFVRNVPELLTAPGECCIDPVSGVVYAWTAGGPVDRQTMAVPTARNVVRICGREGAPVRNVHVADLDIGMADEDAVSLSDAEACSIRGCRIENGGRCGVSVSGRATRIEVCGNEIGWHGQHGVELHGLPPGQPDVNHHHEVRNNHIHHCGRLIGHGYGVSIYQSGHNRVLNNHIHDLPRYGTTIKGLRYQVLRKQVPGVTFTNRHDFLHSRNNLIAHNHIHHVNQDSQDTGAMESWGPGRDNVYDHNLIHDVGIGGFTHDLQSGMYLDDATDHFTVTRNVIYGVGGVTLNQPIFAKGIGNVIDNNVLIAARNNDCGIRSMFMADERCDGHIYTRNIVVLENPKASLYGFWAWSADRVARSDSNLFWNAEGSLRMDGAPAGTLEEWRKLGFDAHSAVADPLFVNAAGRDYRLRPESPAVKLGIESIDVSTVGLEKDYPARLSRE